MEKNGKAFYADDSPEFYRIYFAESCFELLRIPPAFLAKFDGDEPRIVMLEGAKGRRWRIVVKKDDQSLFLQEGWPDFVEDNSLVDGDFLTFCYDGDSSFYVKIFGRHACRKDIVLTRNSSCSLHNRKSTHPRDNFAGEFSSTRIIRRRLRPRDDTGKVRSITLRTRDDAAAKLNVTSLSEKTLRPKEVTGAENVSSTTLRPIDDGAVKLSITSLNKRRLRPRDNTGKVVSSALSSRDDAVVKLSITSLSKRTLQPKDDTTGKVKSGALDPRNNTVAKLSIALLNKRTLPSRDVTGKFVSTKLSVTSLNKRTLFLMDDAFRSSNTGLIGRTKRLIDNAGGFISTQYTRRKLRPRDETGKVIGSRLAH